MLDELMPGFEFDEVHTVRLSTSPDRAPEAVESVPFDEMPPVRLLFAIRSLPARIGRKRGLPADGEISLYEQMLDFAFVRLAEKPGREVVCGGIGQMFEPRAGVAPAVGDARSFLASREPGYAKVAMSFSAEVVEGGARLTTETRVLTTDLTSRRRFGRYWRMVRPGSAAIRGSWLRAAKRRAERGYPVGVRRDG